MSRIRALIRDLVPPLIFRQLRKRLRLRGDLAFSGDYPDWQSAAAQCTGYGDDAILEEVRKGALSVKNGHAADERDSKLFGHIEYSWPLLASLMRVAACNGGLRVVDFGGALGTTLRQNQRYLDGLPKGVQWRVVEQPNFVKVGRDDFEDDVLSFHSTLGEAAAGGVDVVLLGGVLNYLEDPHAVMREIGVTDADYLIVDRTALVEGNRDVISIQQVPEWIYRARYPIRKFCRGSLRELLAGWTTLEQWKCELQPDTSSISFGFFCRRESSLTQQV